MNAALRILTWLLALVMPCNDRFAMLMRVLSTVPVLLLLAIPESCARKPVATPESTPRPE